VDRDDVVVTTGAGVQRYAFAESPLVGAHNRENLLAAITAAAAWGATPEAIRAGMLQTTALPHRLEFVRERGGVRWYDDSKATNVGAVEKSIDSFPNGIVLLLGGYDKGGEFSALRPRLAERVAQVICFGKAGPQIAAAVGATQSTPGAAAGNSPRHGRADAVRVVRGLRDAVHLAAQSAQAGQVVLLAPGCASFDEFRDYNERGEHFRAWVEAL